MVDFFMIFMWTTFFLVIAAFVGFVYTALYNPEAETSTTVAKTSGNTSKKDSGKKKKSRKN